MPVQVRYGAHRFVNLLLHLRKHGQIDRHDLRFCRQCHQGFRVGLFLKFVRAFASAAVKVKLFASVPSPTLICRFVLRRSQQVVAVVAELAVTILFPQVLRTTPLLDCGGLSLYFLGHPVAAEPNGQLAAKLARFARLEGMLRGEVSLQGLADDLFEGLLVSQVHDLVNVHVEAGIRLGSIRQDQRVVETLVHQPPRFFRDLVLGWLFRFLVRVIAFYMLVKPVWFNNNLLLHLCVSWGLAPSAAHHLLHWLLVRLLIWGAFPTVRVVRGCSSRSLELMWLH